MESIEWMGAKKLPLNLDGRGNKLLRNKELPENVSYCVEKTDEWNCPLLLQFLGFSNQPRGILPGRRQRRLVGVHDIAGDTLLRYVWGGLDGNFWGDLTDGSGVEE